MPTSYTEGVGKGEITTLEEYALLCARAFEGLISTKEEPLTTPIPEKIKADTRYYDEKISTIEREIALIVEATESECDVLSKKEYEQRIKSLKDYRANNENQRRMYESMTAKVSEWEVPKELVELKGFMLSQLAKSIRFDCPEPEPEPESESKSEPEQKLLSGSSWRAEKIKELSDQLTFYTSRRDKAIDSARRANEWLSILRNSLKSHEQAKSKSREHNDKHIA